MRTHRKVISQFSSYLKNELSLTERQAIESHVRSCEGCARELQSLREMMEYLAVNSRKPSEHRSELYWQHFAEKVERRLSAGTSEEASPSLVAKILDLLVENRKPFGIGFASALSLIMIAFAVWSLWIKSSESDQIASDSSSYRGAGGQSINFQKASLESRTEDYLEQSKVLLIGIVNSDPRSLSESSLLLRRQKEVSRVLVRQSEELTSELKEPSQRRLKELVSDLGLILVQISNLEASHDVQGVEIVKSGVERNGILFKINLEEMQRMTRSAPRKEIDKTFKPTI